MKLSEDEMRQAWELTKTLPVPDSFRMTWLLIYDTSPEAGNNYYKSMLNWVEEMQEKFGDLDE